MLGEWSGAQDWSVFTASLSPGTHTAVWEYKKDGSGDRDEDRAWIDDVLFPESAVFTSIDDGPGDEVPSVFRLEQNYPNPFNPTTTISFSLPGDHHVTLAAFDAMGRRVELLLDSRRGSGRHDVQFDATGLPSGVYYYELRAGAFTERRAMVLAR